MNREVRSAIVLLCLLFAGCTSPSRPPARNTSALPDAVVQQALETKLSGQVASWRTLETGVRGTVTPVRTYRGANGYCRDYEVTVTERSGGESAWQDTACRDGGGVWRPLPPQS